MKKLIMAVAVSMVTTGAYAQSVEDSIRAIDQMEYQYDAPQTDGINPDPYAGLPPEHQVDVGDDISAAHEQAAQDEASQNVGNENVEAGNEGFNLEGSLNSNIGNYHNDTSVVDVTTEGDNVTTNYSGSQVSNNNSTYVNKSRTGAAASSAIAPSMGTSGYDSCSQGLTGAVSGPGFGLSLGKHIEDDTCEIIKLTKLAYSMGLKDVGLAIAAQDKRFARALAVVNPELHAKIVPVKDDKEDRKKRKKGPRK